MKLEKLIEHVCLKCKEKTGLWTDESMHSCLKCKEWSLMPTGVVVETMCGNCHEESPSKNHMCPPPKFKLKLVKGKDDD